MHLYQTLLVSKLPSRLAKEKEGLTFIKPGPSYGNMRTISEAVDKSVSNAKCWAMLNSTDKNGPEVV
jgi:hypothetical protein